MIFAGLFGMVLKFMEVFFGLMYWNINEDGLVFGGLMYYFDKGLVEKGVNWGMFGKVLVVLFVIVCIGGSFGGGNMVQINQVINQLIIVIGGDVFFFSGQGWIFGLIMVVFIGIIIIGGIKSIVKVMDKIVFFMVGIYVLGVFIVFGVYFIEILVVFGIIIDGVFNVDVLYGGIVGVLIQGFCCVVFFNEVGVGFVLIVYFVVKIDELISEGVVVLLEFFIDIVVICIMIVLVIVIINYGGNGVEWVFNGLND